jgi:hypothetical protein
LILKRTGGSRGKDGVSAHADDRARLWFFNAVSHGVGVADWIGES